jgi:multidrug efflux pump
LVSGAGAAARNSIGITIVAGMALGTVFTLLVIPAIYVLIAKQHAGEEPGALGHDFAEAEAVSVAPAPAVAQACSRAGNGNGE